MSLDNFQICDWDLDRASAARYLGSEAIAVDTETMGLVMGRDRLCLVQLCDSQGYVTVVRIEKGQKSAPNLERVLQAKDVTKVFHFARFDVAQFRYTFGIETAPIFCTKIASKLARTYTSSHGLKSLISELMGVTLDKSSQSSDWGDLDSLSEEQLSYAGNDVRYLLEAQDKLTTMLKREDRWGLAKKCFECVPVFAVLDIMHYQNIFEH
ncbi:Ribonuclease D [Hyella patelloides LEGE 07179]|uniref:Ribonuclease D n=1 Tax=Hyella patelloides LEGE 07179 TaxID=945734 RepID=A0A563W0W4_9CYAN|nr:ribonuclease H-like domain-containing protein [Hyella patelloides]VEP17285.1 Ribonuclease D [Hyella patelloides LEGE 07179]